MLPREDLTTSKRKVKLDHDPKHEMLSDVFTFSEMLRDDSYDVKVYADGSIYKGQFKYVNGKKQREGKGAMLYTNGRVYEGHWK